MTKALEERVRLHRKYWKGKGKLSVVRKGQPTGCAEIVVIEPHQTRRMFYYPDGTLAKQVIERPLFTPAVEQHKPTSALYLNTKDN